MKYQGSFKDVNNKDYTVTITTDSSGTTSELVLGDSPVILEWVNEDHLYMPVRYSTATIKIITNNWMPDLYASTAQQVKVEIQAPQNFTPDWYGYVTPNLYSQPYEASIEELEVEAIDGLATLQYYKYEPILGSKNIVSFKTLLDYLIFKCNCYSGYYISTSNSFAPEELFISEQNFFDEDDEPMTCQEVLEMICMYLNKTAIADGDYVMFYDWDSLKDGEQLKGYYSDGSYGYTLNREGLKTINNNIIAQNGTQISLDNVYNKVILKDSLYSFDSVIPSIWDDDKLTNWSGNWYYKEERTDGDYLFWFRFYKHQDYISHYYNVDYLGANGFGTASEVYPSVVSYNTVQNYVGATICRHYCFKKEKNKKKPSSIDWSDYLLLHTHRPALHDHALFDPMYLSPIFELNVNTVPPSFIPSNAYLVIQGQGCWMDLEKVMYKRDHSRDGDDFKEDNLYLTCTLSIGLKYWNGSGWQDTYTAFRLPFDAAGNTDHYIGQTKSIKNTVTYDMNIDLEGYAIPMPTGEVTTGKPTLKIYAPSSVNGSHRTDAVWLKDFDIKCVIPVDEKTDKDSDTEYSNIVNEEFVEEFEAEDFKICTWDNKEVNYSAVCYRDSNGKYQFLDRMSNTGTGQYLRPEEQYIYRIANQYSTPSIKMRINLNINEIRYFSGNRYKIPLLRADKTFIADSYILDLRYNKAEVTLIEKK